MRKCARVFLLLKIIMGKNILSKSTFIKGEQCIKALYLYKNRYFLRDKMPPERVAVFMRGTKVGKMAQQLFPYGVDCGVNSPSQYSKAIEKTRNLIDSGQKIIYEAAFQAHRTLIFLDILVNEDDSWHAYEVKSSLKLSPTYYKDAALQYFIMKESGLDLKSINLVYINENYTLNKELNLNSAFKIEDVTQNSIELYSSIKEKIDNQITAIQGTESPKIDIGLHCRNPYDCDFIGHCWKHISKESIFNIPDLSFENKYKIFIDSNNQKDIIESILSENLIAKRQFQSHINNLTFYNHEKFTEIFIPNSGYYLLKLLSFRPAIPIYHDTQPYQKIIYGFYLMKMSEQNELIETEIYVNKENVNPNEIIINKLNSIIKPSLRIYTYKDYSGKDETNFNNPVYNLIDIFKNGDIVIAGNNNYNFSTIYKSTFGKSAWFSKITIDEQAAIIYEKSLRNNFENVD